MKKLYTLLMMCLIGTVASWAEDTYESVYSRALANWASDDISDWNGASAVEINATNGLGANANQTATYVSKSFTIGSDNKIKYEVDWTYATATGRPGNYNWIQFGDFLRIAINSSYNMYLSTDAGDTWNATTLGNYYNGTYTKHIEVIFNTKSKTVENLTFDGTDRTSLVSGKFNSATFNTISTGFIRGGSVNWTLANYLTNVYVSQAVQEATDDVSYTINYKYNNGTIKSVNETGTVGNTINAESPILIDNVKYYAADGATTSLTLGSDATKNVLNVDLRQAGTQTVKINAVDSDNNVLKTFSDTRIEGEATANLYYTRAIEYNGKYYTVPAANGNVDNYAVSMAYGSDDVNITYTLNEDIMYYAEETELNLSGTFRGNPQAQNRASGGSWNNLTANSYLYTNGLNSGIYKVEVSARNHGSGEGSLAIQVRSADGDLISTAGTVAWGAANCSVQMVEGVAVPENAVIAIAETAGATSNVDIDYLIAYRTGDLTEDITINSTGVSSYVTTYALDFSDVEGLAAMIAEDETEEQIRLRKVTEVPAGTAIIVRGTPGQTYTVHAGSCTELEGNLLQGSVTEGFDVSTATMPVYALKNSDGEFHHVASTVVIPAKKAYLISQFDNAASAKGFKVLGEEEEEATAVSAVSAAEGEKSAKLYNAAGQLVGAAYKGLVIDENGNKYVR